MNKVAIASLFIVGCLPLYASADTGTYESNPITLTVEARSTSSEPQVRVTITNTTGKELDIPGTSPREIMTILVTDSDGNLAQPTDLVLHSHSIDIMVPLRLKPGESYIIGNRSEHNNGWIPLSDWGYPNLPKGNDTLSARPGILLNGRADVKPYTASEAKLRPSIETNSVSIAI